MPPKKQTAESAEAEWVAIDSLSPWEKNPRLNAEAVPAVAASIKRFGWGNPILARRADRVVIAGHTRLKAAESLGMDKVLVRWMDLDPAQAAALALADNRVGEIAGWDDAALREVLADLEAQEVDLSGLGWSDEEMQALLGEVGGGALPGPETGDVPPLEKGEPSSKPGEVYHLGPHLLWCGSNDDAVIRLSSTEGIDAVVTDPPYGIGASEFTMGKGESNKPKGERLSEVDPWDRSAPSVAWLLGVARCVCVWGGNYFPDLPVSDKWLVWHKKNDGRSFSEAELAWTNFSPRVRVLAHHWGGEKKDHITQKPLEVLLWSLSWLPTGVDRVLDPFGGSGTTLIACAQTGRVARLIEIDPHYCDVIRRRWTRYAKEHGLDPGPGALAEVS